MSRFSAPLSPFQRSVARQRLMDAQSQADYAENAPLPENPIDGQSAARRKAFVNRNRMAADFAAQDAGLGEAFNDNRTFARDANARQNNLAGGQVDYMASMGRMNDARGRLMDTTGTNDTMRARSDVEYQTGPMTQEALARTNQMNTMTPAMRDALQAQVNQQNLQNKGTVIRNNYIAPDMELGLEQRKAALDAVRQQNEAGLPGTIATNDALQQQNQILNNIARIKTDSGMTGQAPSELERMQEWRKMAEIEGNKNYQNRNFFDRWFWSSKDQDINKVYDDIKSKAKSGEYSAPAPRQSAPAPNDKARSLLDAVSNLKEGESIMYAGAPHKVVIRNGRKELMPL